MKAINTVRLASGKVFFGPGPRRLFQEIEKTGSLRKATFECGVSYTKALRIIREMEEQLGFAMVETEKGGSQRGGTRLTLEGKQLLSAYILLEEELQQIAQTMVEEKFAFLQNKMQA